MNLKLLDIQYLRGQNTTVGQVLVAGPTQSIGTTNAIVVVNGNVGIGSSTPSSPLSVAGNVAIFGSNSAYIFSDGTAQYTSAANAVLPSGSLGAIQYNNNNRFGGDAANLYWDDVNFRLGVGTNTPRSSFQIIDVGYESTNTSTSGITPVILDSFPVPYYRSCHYIVQITDENNSWYQTSQLMLIQDGLNTYQTEYNIVVTQTRLGELTCQIASGNVQLLFTASYTSDKNIKVIRTSIEP